MDGELGGRSFELVPLGDSALIVRFGTAIDPDSHRRATALAELLGRSPFPGMRECVPSYAAVAVHYDPFAVLQRAGEEAEQAGSVADIVKELLRRKLAEAHAVPPREPDVVDIPVCYGGEFGPDLAFVAANNGLTEPEAIDIHTGGVYTVYMIGFAPGFPYIGGMPERIATPRRETPRTEIPAGSVGIGGKQTGVYPIATPGGWQLIGRTPLRLFRPEAAQPSLLRAGDRIRFRSIGRDEFRRYEEGSE